jgi:hypothetical protein
MISLHPDLALGMLRQEKTSSGRIWLLLRTIDVDGRGWVSSGVARERLTSKSSSLRVCGWRQLRNLLAQGEDVFWLRDKERIWLRSVAKVAAALGVQRLAGHPVAIDASVLTQGIGLVRAHFYASFHSGRIIKSGRGRHESMPISRKTIKSLCHISRRTQRNYERRADVQCRQNYSIGPQAKTEDEQEIAWKRGQAVFHLTDRKGKQGSSGKTYVAWQLPNNYFGPHAHRPRGRQKRINQELADLFTQGMTGNGKQMVVSDRVSHTKRFYANGRQAAKAYNRPGRHDIYWCSPQLFRNKRAQVWHVLRAKSDAF